MKPLINNHVFAAFFFEKREAGIKYDSLAPQGNT